LEIGDTAGWETCATDEALLCQQPCPPSAKKLSLEPSRAILSRDPNSLERRIRGDAL
jgi:hypothetical protein